MKKVFLGFLNIRENTDFEKTKSIISEGVTLRGYNLWLLVCSTILSCIGLDTNSAAVIIGAMLISPLMSPILGVGLSLAIHDKQLLTRSLRNLFAAVLISLGVSVIYFFLSPLGAPTPELQARTYPTLLDVLVALFGGVAGIVSTSRHQATMAIPGVAIATALMPPLCTAGFGLGTSNWNYFFGALYLFFINAVFISLATYLIARYLRFPERPFVDKRVAGQYRKWFLIISMIALTPSIYFLYTLYRDELIKTDIDELVITPIKKQGNEILKWEIAYLDTVNQIKIYYSGRQLSDSFKHQIDNALIQHKLAKYYFMPMRVNLTKDEVNQLSAEMTMRIIDELHLQEIKDQNLLTQQSENALPFPQLNNETKIAFPFIDTLSSGWILYQDTLKSVDTIPVIFYKTTGTVTTDNTRQFYTYLRERLAKDTVLLIKW
ncbi:MAG: TIGR00341 family protein [Ginsengibacter sp.]